MRGQHQRRRPLIVRIVMYVFTIIALTLYVAFMTGLLVVLGLVVLMKATA